MKFKNIWITTVCFTLLVSISNIVAQTNFVPKQGGICFRTDDNQPIEKYLQYGDLFTSYNQKFTLAINFGRSSITTPYIAGLKTLQQNGHEIMDHTPMHRTHNFYALFPDDYIDHPGVSRISGTKIELEHKQVNISDSKRNGYVDINGNILTSSSGDFGSFDLADIYLYFPDLDILVTIEDWIDSYTVEVRDVWRNSTDLGSYNNIQYYNFDYDNVHLTKDGIKALAEESIRRAEYYELTRPYTWIQPGGYFPHVERNELKEAISELGYKSAGIFPNPSLKVFNEHNSNNDKQFGMNFGDFRDDVWTLQKNKEYIANRIAKHHVIMGHSHFANGGLLGGWNGFMERTEGLIQWCIEKNIPIRTYEEWADMLYTQTPNPQQNVFPKLNVDLDGNGIPDGYDDIDLLNLDKVDGAPNQSDFSIKINSTGEMFSISDLGGVEKGENEFSIWTKGSPGNFIEVSFKAHGNSLNVFKFLQKILNGLNIH